MHTLEVLETGTKLEFPSKIAEFNPAQFLRFCKDFCRLQDGLILEEDFLVALVLNCLELEPFKSRKLNEEESSRLVMNLEEVSAVMGSFWTIPDGEKEAVIDWFFTDQKVPVIEWAGQKYFGPADQLSDLTYGEYEKAHTYYSVYLRDKDPKLLDSLISELYRPEERAHFGLKGTGKKVAIDKHDRQAAEQWASLLPFHVKFAVFVWWGNMEQFIRLAEIQTDAGPVQLEVLFKQMEVESRKVEDNTGIRGVLYHLAESAVFGTIKEVERAPFWDVMLRLYQMRKNHEAEKARIDEMRQKAGGGQ